MSRSPACRPSVDIETRRWQLAPGTDLHSLSVCHHVLQCLGQLHLSLCLERVLILCQHGMREEAWCPRWELEGYSELVVVTAAMAISLPAQEEPSARSPNRSPWRPHPQPQIQQPCAAPCSSSPAAVAPAWRRHHQPQKGRERKGNERDRGDVGIEAREDNTPFVSNVSHFIFFR